MDAMIFTLIAWIVAHSSFGVAQAPHIQFVPKQEMSGAYARAVNDVNRFQVQAFYLPATGTVYLPRSWQATDLRDESMLVHELVHHLQKTNNVEVSCPAALERQAYALQLAWLREQGVADPYEFTGLDILTVIMAGSCPE
jgi:antirestriction protein ArdC